MTTHDQTATATKEWTRIPAYFDAETDELVWPRDLRTQANVPFNFGGQMGFGFAHESRAVDLFDGTWHEVKGAGSDGSSRWTKFVQTADGMVRLGSKNDPAANPMMKALGW